MPIYEYKCEECGSIFEHFQRITDNNLQLCKCGKKGNIKKLISSSGFRLKGSGWYETDFKTKNEKTKKSTSSSNKS